MLAKKRGRKRGVTRKKSIGKKLSAIEEEFREYIQRVLRLCRTTGLIISLLSYETRRTLR